jgi:HSP20 family molecular chaperone IbpA
MSNILNNRWGSLFDEPFFQDIFNVFNTKTTYPYNIDAYEDRVVIEIPLAGYKKDNISLEVEDNILSLKVSKKEEKDSTGKYMHKGISNRDLFFKWNLHSSLDSDSIQSTFEDGMLVITIKGKHKEKNKKLIEIK